MKRQGTEYRYFYLFFILFIYLFLLFFLQVFLEHVSDKELVSRICKLFLKINKKKTIEKQGKELSLPFKKRVYTVY